MADVPKAALAAAVLGGYVLGRTKKGRVAFAMATYLAGRRIGLEPQQMLAEGIKRLRELPQFEDLNEQLRGEVLDAGRRAVSAVADRKLADLADSLHQRTERIGSRGQEEPQDEDEAPEDEYGEEEEPEDAEREEEGEEAEDEYEEDEEEPEEGEEEPEEEEEEPEDEHQPEKPARHRRPARQADEDRDAGARRGRTRERRPEKAAARKAPAKKPASAKRTPAARKSSASPDRTPAKKSGAKKATAKKASSARRR